MVKRIKKRIPKAEEPELELEDGAGEPGTGEPAAIEFEAEPQSLGEQIEAMAEDEFTEKTAGLFKWIIENGKVLAAVGIIAVGAGIAYNVMQSSGHSKNAEASAAFFGAAEAQAKASPIAAGEAPSADERKAQLEKARQLYQSTQTSYSDRKVAALAGFGLAGVQAGLGDQDAALKGFDAFLGQAEVDPFAKIVAMQAKATAQENKKDFAGAIATWEAVKAADAKAYGLLAGLEIGRLQEQQSKPDAARKTYEALKKDHAEELEGMAGRAYKAELDKRLGRLGS
ncbi:MAG: tetratricopeptide repeat protein [Myxococcales bacterium]|nr:tetratricopeptide repeat protein [Myxococcales bacterium]MCB9522167.1 tetratricopeptide repeat protein [Myxococcales bacterium]